MIVRNYCRYDYECCLLKYFPHIVIPLKGHAAFIEQRYPTLMHNLIIKQFLPFNYFMSRLKNMGETSPITENVANLGLTRINFPLFYFRSIFHSANRFLSVKNSQYSQNLCIKAILE